MILPFSTQINGDPTYFPEKILKGLYDNRIITVKEIQDRLELRILVRKGEFHEINFDHGRLHQAKLHTIRQDKNDRWKPGVMIDFFINARQKNMFRFAPRIPVVSVQKIKIVHFLAEAHIYLDDSFYGEIFFNGNKEIDGYAVNIEELAINDGFYDAEDFIAYFNKDFTGKIIHWTDLRY